MLLGTDVISFYFLFFSFQSIIKAHKFKPIWKVCRSMGLKLFNYIIQIKSVRIFYRSQVERGCYKVTFCFFQPRRGGFPSFNQSDFDNPGAIKISSWRFITPYNIILYLFDHYIIYNYVTKDQNSKIHIFCIIQRNIIFIQSQQNL